MKVLFITTPGEDYLSDGLLHGFKKLLGSESVIDYPKKEILYNTVQPEVHAQIRGAGFTLYTGLLEDIRIDRFNILEKVSQNYFTLIVFSDIHRQFGWFTQLRPWLTSKNTIIIDGADSEKPYPNKSVWLKHSYYWSLPKAHKEFLYFKRELTSQTFFNPLLNVLPKSSRQWFSYTENVRPISFSIPEEKICKTIPDKIKDFTKHIVDPEVAAVVKESVVHYAFKNEADYYADLQQSKFGITTKRAGWDCLRHYELAANGVVLCFKDFDKKNRLCAPHDLNKSFIINYENAQDLMEQLNHLTPNQYDERMKKTLEWVKGKTTIKVAENVLTHIF